MDYEGFIPDVGEYNSAHARGEHEKIPQSTEAEQAIIGALLYDNLAVYPEIRDILKPEDFFDRAVNGRMAERIFNLSRRGELADAIVLKNKFERDDILEEIGGVEHIAALLTSAPPISTAKSYAKLVADLAAKRKIIGLARAVLHEARDPMSDMDAETLIEEMQTDVSTVQGTFPSTATFVSLKEAGQQAVDAIGQNRPMGLPTGYDELDEKISGLGRGKLITIAGRPSMGKTALAMNIARNVATFAGVDHDGNDILGKVGFFSQEMPAIELGERALSAATGPSEGIQYQDITKHKITKTQKLILLDSVAKIPDIMIDETAGLTYSAIEKRARHLEKQLGGLDVLVVDYLQLMEGSDSPDPRDQVKYYGWISNNFKTLAKKMNIAVVLLSQLSRKVEERENQRPRKSDLKGSGTIEDASDVILFVFRPEVPLVERGEPTRADQKEKYFQDLNWSKGRMEVIIGKNKGGPLGTVSLRSFMGYDVITEYADETGEGFDEQIPF